MPATRPKYHRDTSLPQPHSHDKSHSRSPLATPDCECATDLQKPTTVTSSFQTFNTTQEPSSTTSTDCTSPSLFLTPATPFLDPPDIYPYLLSPKGTEVKANSRMAQASSEPSARTRPVSVTAASEPSSPSPSRPARPTALSAHSVENTDTTTSTTPTSRRPLLTRAATTPTAQEAPTSTPYGAIFTTPTSRPPITRATTTANAVRTPLLPTQPQPTQRPSLWRRATSAAINTLELSAKTSATHLNAPPKPTYWLNIPHRQTLIQTWDRVQEEAAAASSRLPKSITAQVLSVEKRMVMLFPQLVDGEQPLSREWIEYVLGVALRAPFSSSGKMGRWEILASNSAGARLNWGPW
ncbi:hypothetical protein Tdes44962_MAKER02657 [Teratosphaeria destructans]|uniref:Uncharacterized protein n=1 Tax=Teratosphaeria destructans TaxID=418781 RepID=A0A9W7W2I3_9PEZI|nr:hypothetical protein Tdes44962_MAKER02657 [Teratosphaeria destructans]